MSTSEDEPASATAFWQRPQARTLLAASANLAVGMIAGGYLLGDGLTRARMGDRAVTVRGLAERDVMADLATWTLSDSARAGDLSAAQASVDRATAATRASHEELGSPADTLQP